MFSNYLLSEVADYAEDRVSIRSVSLDDYVTTDNLLPNKQGLGKATNLPPQTGNMPAYKSGDILIGNIRPYLKKIWHADRQGGCSADVLTIRTKEHHDSRFVYYALFRDDFFKHMMRGSKGTKMPRGDKAQIMRFTLPKFDKVNQQKIAAILSSIDAKIDLNNRINAELEAMAKTLYDYWFVQFDFPDENGKPYKSSGGKMEYNPTLKRHIPAGWKVDKLTSFISNDKTGDWGKDTSEGNYTFQVSCIRGADINGINGLGDANPPTRLILEKNAHKTLVPYEIIIEISGGSPTQSTGRLAFITKETMERFENPLICSNFCKAISLKHNTFFYWFIYLWNSIYENGILFDWEGKTSGIKNLLFDAFTEYYQLAAPPQYLAHDFSSYVAPLQVKKQINLKENQQLTQLRDWLLPMLMNGQVKIKDAENTNIEAA